MRIRAATLAMLFSIVGIVSPTLGAPVAEDGLRPHCPEVLVYVARDWHEKPGAGALGSLTRNAVEVMTHRHIRVTTLVTGVRYDAPTPRLLARSPSAYADRISAAAEALTQTVSRDRAVQCQAASDLAFIGYGTGAWIVRGTLRNLSREAQSRVKGVLLYGDAGASSSETVIDFFAGAEAEVKGLAYSRAMRRALDRYSRPQIPARIQAQTLSYCISDDPYCWIRSNDRGASPAVLSKRLRSGHDRHRFYALKRQYYGGADWLGPRLTTTSLAPRVLGKYKQGEVGEALTWTFAAEGSNPPFRINIDDAALADTGLEVQGASVTGVPERDLERCVRVSVTDGVGRISARRFCLSVRYPEHGTALVSEDTGQDRFGDQVGEPSVSGDGRYVAFGSGVDLSPEDRNAATDVYVKDMTSEEMILLSRSSNGGSANGASTRPEMTPDGRWVAFESKATNITAEQEPGIFLHDREASTTTWIGRGAHPSLSADGKFLAYESGDSARVTFVDLEAGAAQSVDLGYISAGSSQLSGDGRYLVFATKQPLDSEDQTPGWSAYRLDRDSLQSRLIGTDDAGEALPLSTRAPSINHDGTVVAFEASKPGYLGAVYIKNLESEELTRIAEPLNIGTTSLSGDGMRLAYEILDCRGSLAAVGFYSARSGKRAGIWDTRTEDGFYSGYSATPDISANGSHVAFTNVPTNGPVDVLLATPTIP